MSLAAKSSSAYNDLCYDSTTGSDLSVLPSLRTNYKNYIKPTKALNPDVINDLRMKTASFSEIERHVTILFDEMRIQEDLVWDEHAVELIRFVGLDDVYTNYITLKSVEKLASHDLVLLVKRLSIHFPVFCKFCHKWSNFISDNANILESSLLKAVAATTDGASPNRTQQNA